MLRETPQVAVAVSAGNIPAGIDSNGLYLLTNERLEHELDEKGGLCGVVTLSMSLSVGVSGWL